MHKRKSSQQVYSIQAFQNGRFALLEIPSQRKRFSLQDRSLFPSAAVLDLKKVCEICLVGKSLRVSLPLFWIKACSLDIFKAIKVAIALLKRLNIRLVIYLDDILLMGRILEEMS